VGGTSSASANCCPRPAPFPSRTPICRTQAPPKSLQWTKPTTTTLSVPTFPLPPRIRLTPTPLPRRLSIVPFITAPPSARMLMPCRSTSPSASGTGRLKSKTHFKLNSSVCLLAPTTAHRCAKPRASPATSALPKLLSLSNGLHGTCFALYPTERSDRFHLPAYPNLPKSPKWGMYTLLLLTWAVFFFMGKHIKDIAYSYT
jgi:hypothetical protein